MILGIDTVAISKIAAAIATLILAIIAIINIVNTNRIMREQRRPYIAIECFVLRGSSTVYLDILNVGKSAAVNVAIVITTMDGGREIEVLNEQVPYIAPGRGFVKAGKQVRCEFSWSSYGNLWC